MQLTIRRCAYLCRLISLPRLPMTDEEFAAFLYGVSRLLHRDDGAEGEIVIMPPQLFAYWRCRTRTIMAQLRDWATGDGRGIATDCFRRVPAAQWSAVGPGRGMDAEEPCPRIECGKPARFWHLCPDFVIELRSHTDRLPVLRAKMQEWIDNGARLAWLIDPEREAVEIYRAGQKPDCGSESRASRVKGRSKVSCSICAAFGIPSRIEALFRIHPEIVEVGHRIALSPQSDFAAILECFVLRLQDSPMIHVDLKLAAAHGDF